MYRSSKKMMSTKHRLNSSSEYSEIVDMLESGMEESEIASELGLSLNYLKKIKDENLKDI